MANVIFGQKRRIFFKLLVFAIFLATPIIGLAATYYVSPTGSDSNPGTLASPWGTLAKAVSSVSSGDTVYLRSGTWNERLIFSSKAYTSKVTFARYPGDAEGSAILNGTGFSIPAWEGVVQCNNSDNIRIEGLKAMYSTTGNGISTDGGSYIEVIDCFTDYTCKSGIMISGADHVTVQGNSVKHACYTTLYPNSSEEPISITGFASYVTVSYNEVSDGANPPGGGGEGINCKNGANYCWVHHNVVHTGNDRYAFGVDGWDHETHHIYIYNNLAYDSGYGYVVETEQGGRTGRKTHDIYVYNNIAYDNSHDGIIMPGALFGTNPGDLENIYFYNNTVVDNGRYGIYFYDDNITNVVCRNNLCYNNARGQIYIRGGVPLEQITSDHNLTSGNPSFLDYNGHDFHLTASSTLVVNLGATIAIVTDDFDGVTRPQYAAYDIGAYEYSGTNPPLSANASANPTSGPAPLTVNFSGSATGGAPSYSYSWTFGDGGSSTAQNPSHTYSSAGTYAAILTVTDSASSQASDSLTITVISGTVTQQLSLSSTTGAPAPGNGGTTNPAPGTHSYPQGDSVSVQAIPNTNYRFSIWSGDVLAANAYNEQITVNMDKDKSLSAFFCTRCGDVNGDLNISASDAQAAFENFLGRISNPTQCEIENADVNCDGTITPGDAQAIFNKFLGKAELPGDCSGQTRAMAAGIISIQAEEHSATSLSIEDVQVNRDGYIFVPIIIDNPMNMNAFGFDLAFPSNFLTYITLESTELTKGYDQLDANVIPHPAISHKILRVGGYKTHSDQNPSSGILVTLVFRVKGEFKDSFQLSVIATYDDIRNAPTQNGIVHRKNNSQIRDNNTLGRNIEKKHPDKGYDF